MLCSRFVPNYPDIDRMSFDKAVTDCSTVVLPQQRENSDKGWNTFLDDGEDNAHIHSHNNLHLGQLKPGANPQQHWENMHRKTADIRSG